jgi:hypothetical protein
MVECIEGRSAIDIILLLSVPQKFFTACIGKKRAIKPFLDEGIRQAEERLLPVRVLRLFNFK